MISILLIWMGLAAGSSTPAWASEVDSTCERDFIWSEPKTNEQLITWMNSVPATLRNPELTAAQVHALDGDTLRTIVRFLSFPEIRAFPERFERRLKERFASELAAHPEWASALSITALVFRGLAILWENDRIHGTLYAWITSRRMVEAWAPDPIQPVPHFAEALFSTFTDSVLIRHSYETSITLPDWLSAINRSPGRATWLSKPAATRDIRTILAEAAEKSVELSTEEVWRLIVDGVDRLQNAHRLDAMELVLVGYDYLSKFKNPVAQRRASDLADLLSELRGTRSEGTGGPSN